MAAMPEFRVSIVVSVLGGRDAAEDNMERFIDAFEATHPEAGAVMAANFRLETLDATFSVEAKDAKEASEVGGQIFCDAANETGIEPTDILEIQATLVASADHDQQLTGELTCA